MVLRTVAEMQNNVGMTSQIGYFLFISLFGNHFSKIHHKFYENTSLLRKLVQNIIKSVLTVWSFLLMTFFLTTVYNPLFLTEALVINAS